LVSNEIEFEWLRQFLIQGQRHYDLHVWWHQPMKGLELLLLQMEEKLLKVLHILYEASQSAGGSGSSIKGTNHIEKGTTSTIPSVKSKYRHLIQEVSELSYDDAIEQLSEVQEACILTVAFLSLLELVHFFLFFFVVTCRDWRKEKDGSNVKKIS
jgi:hypothetical protein